MKIFLLSCFVSVLGFTLSSEVNGGVLYGYDGYGAYNDATYNISGGFIQQMGYLLDLTARSGYSKGNVKNSDTPYTVFNACLGIDAHNLLGPRNPFIDIGMGYYKVNNIHLNPGNIERFGGCVSLDVRGLIGGSSSPFDIDLRWENHFIPNIPNTYYIYIRGQSLESSSQKAAKEIRTIYARTMSYAVISLGFRFKYL